MDPLIKSQLLYQLSYAPVAENPIGFATTLHTARRGFVQPLGPFLTRLTRRTGAKRLFRRIFQAIG